MVRLVVNCSTPPGKRPEAITFPGPSIVGVVFNRNAQGTSHLQAAKGLIVHGQNETANAHIRNQLHLPKCKHLFNGNTGNRIKHTASNLHLTDVSTKKCISAPRNNRLRNHWVCSGERAVVLPERLQRLCCASASQTSRLHARLCL